MMRLPPAIPFTVLGLLTLVACNSVSADELQALEAAITSAESFSVQLEVDRVAAITTWLNEAPDLTMECPDGVVLEQDRDYGVDEAENLTLILESELSTEPSPRAHRSALRLNTTRTQLDPNSMIAIENGDHLERAHRKVAIWAGNDVWPYEVTYVITDSVAPHMTGSNTFLPGHIAGPVLVWSYAESRIICGFSIRQNTPAGVTLENHPDLSPEQELLMFLRARVTTQIRQYLGSL